MYCALSWLFEQIKEYASQSPVCNLCCKHCGQWNLLIDTEAPSVEESIAIANNLTKIATSVTLLGGEPFLAPAIEDVCRIFSENNISVDLITNGQIYNQTVERIFSLENIKNIYISLDDGFYYPCRQYHDDGID